MKTQLTKENYFSIISVNLRNGMHGFLDDTVKVIDVAERHGFEEVGTGMGLWKDAQRDVEFIYNNITKDTLVSKLAEIKKELRDAGFTSVEVTYEIDDYENEV